MSERTTPASRDLAEYATVRRSAARSVNALMTAS